MVLIAMRRKTCIVLTVSVYICIFTVCTAGVGGRFRVSEDRVDQPSASSYCQQEASIQADIWSAGRYQYVISNIPAQHRHKTYWLPVKQRNLRGFQWIDNTTDASCFFSGAVQRREGSYCGLLDYTTDHLRTTKCSSLWLGYICQLRNFTSCEDMKVGYKQLSLNSGCYRVYTEKVNWYEARWRCRQEHMDLAVLPDIHRARELAQKINKNFNIFKLTHYWIGFRNIDWTLCSETADSITKNAVLWDYGQPKNHGDCVIAHRVDSTYYWKTESCTSRHHVLCQQVDSSTISIKTTREIPLRPDTHKRQFTESIKAFHVRKSRKYQENRASCASSLLDRAWLPSVLCCIFLSSISTWFTKRTVLFSYHYFTLKL